MRHKKKLSFFTALLLIFCLWFWQCLPERLFQAPVSQVLLAKGGELLNVKIAADEQWRFSLMKEVPDKFRQAIILTEDKRFDQHFGIDLLAIGRAMRQNLAASRVVSGASTISMQVIRLSRQNPPRTLGEKALEALLALRLELRFNKEEILRLYASNAPFGGNIVGLNAAAWSYYRRNPAQLSWAETATLAMLPNKPGLIHPGKNRLLLQQRRDRLLKKLLDNGVIDETTYRLSLLEKLPGTRKPFPKLAPHLLETLTATPEMQEGILQTTIHYSTQKRANSIVAKHHLRLDGSGVHNIAALILDNSTGDVLAYVGNAGFGKKKNGGNVDVIRAPRSTGSILKPFLFAAALDEGTILQEMILPDIPLHFRNFSPKNFNKKFLGIIPADQALASSTNIPAVVLLQRFGYQKFHHLLKKMGMTTLSQPASHYGLSLILGGGEGTVWDVAGIYSSMARLLNSYHETGGIGGDYSFRSPNVVFGKAVAGNAKAREILSPEAIWLTFETLRNVKRPESEGSWDHFSSSQRIAWKTGTSFGFRDAWAIGVTPKHTVAVWVGNAEGDGRPELIGVQSAAPVMFELFDSLVPDDSWFHRVDEKMVEVEVCSISGHKATKHCEKIKKEQVLQEGLRTKPCPYHRVVHLDEGGKWQVHGGCVSPFAMVHREWFVLPPVQEWYYRSRSLSYQSLPEFRADCLLSQPGSVKTMELISPLPNAIIHVPTELNETKGRVIFEAVHRESEKTIFWHLDDEYLGSTRHFHQIAVNPKLGKHRLTIVDEDGTSATRVFRVGM